MQYETSGPYALTEDPPDMAENGTPEPDVIDQEQARIRQNMQQLDRNTDLYQSYVKKFGEQEDEVERLRKEMEDLTEEEARLRKALDQYLSELKVE